MDSNQNESVRDESCSALSNLDGRFNSIFVWLIVIFILLKANVL